MEVKVKKLNKNAIIPSYAKQGDAGLDLVAISKVQHENLVEYGTGLAIEIPEGYVGLIFPRSSIKNYDLSLTNCVGVVDSGYRGEIKAFFRTHGDTTHYNVMEKIAQMVIVPYPQIKLVEVAELSESERGTGGYGSSGK